MGFSRQEHWSGSPFPSPGDLPDPRDWNEVSCIVGRCYTVWATCELDQSECWRINALELWCWRRLPVLKEINPDYSLEGLRLKLKFQYSGYLIQRANWLEKTLMLGKIWGQEEKGQQRMRSLDGIINSVDMSLSNLWEIVKYRDASCATVYGVKNSQTWLSN